MQGYHATFVSKTTVGDYRKKLWAILPTHSKAGSLLVFRRPPVIRSHDRYSCYDPSSSTTTNSGSFVGHEQRQGRQRRVVRWNDESSIKVLQHLVLLLQQPGQQTKRLLCNQPNTPGGTTRTTVRALSSSSSSKQKDERNVKNSLIQQSVSSSLQALTIGSVAGMMGSLAGMGGGFIMIPLMTSQYLLNLNQHQAHGTSLFAVTATGIAGAIGYASVVQSMDAICIAMGGILTARLGAQTTTILSASTLKRALGILMICIAPLVPAKSYLQNYYSSKEHKQHDNNILPAPIVQTSTTVVETTTSSDEQQVVAVEVMKHNGDSMDISSIAAMINRYGPSFGIGLCSGYLAGLFGVGGGVLVVPALSVVTNMNHYEALGTSLAAMTLPALTGTYTHYKSGNVAIRIAPFLAMGALVGAYVGGHYVGLHTHELTLKWGFAGLIAMLGIRTIIKS